MKNETGGSPYPDVPPPLPPGTRVQFRTRTLRQDGWLGGTGTVEFEWWAEDERAVKIRPDIGSRSINVLPDLGDELEVLS